MKVSWDDDIPNIWKVIKFDGSKPPISHTLYSNTVILLYYYFQIFSIKVAKPSTPSAKLAPRRFRRAANYWDNCGDRNLVLLSVHPTMTP